MVRVLILINVVVYLAWQFADPDLLEFLSNNFTVSWTGLMEGRWWTLLTSVFSHNFLLHLFINMFVLNSFGSLIEQVLGSWRFLRFYILAGVVASFSHAVMSAFIVGDPSLSAVGASGAIAGTVLVFALMFPREKILLFGLIPIPALIGALAFVALDIWGLSAQAEGGGLPIGHGAHLGGALAGVLYYFFSIRPKWKYAGRHFT
ncbi:MAG: rhomboid family intramembrane serine protease [Bdellovibrionales bacterium]|nr:rhomboid family intramembrane serine protease [Bdellovibrionales bacterium]